VAGIIDKFKTMMLGEEEYEEEDEDYINDEEEEDRVISLRSRAKEKAKLVNINTSVQMKVAVISPESYEDAQEICDNIKENRAVVVNLETVEFEISQRIVDFLSGACYSLNGSIQKISNKIFIIAPENIDITGDFKDELIKTKGVFPWVTGIK
jgi:cell division inhibitor SepF